MAKRIAIFGGSFNPPHVAHQLACTLVLSTARPRVDAVWMVPTFKHPFDKELAPYADRVAMCERAAMPFGGRVVVSRIEEELGGESYTLRTVKALRKRHPDCTFSLVIGADLLQERERWHNFPELERLIDFIVIGRVGYEAGGAIALPPISSTDLRARLGRGESVDGLLPADVFDYIKSAKLYGVS